MPYTRSSYAHRDTHIGDRRGAGTGCGMQQGLTAEVSAVAGQRVYLRNAMDAEQDPGSRAIGKYQ